MIQSLWIGDLSPMEKVSINSFIKNGHEYHLYTYDKIDVPSGVIVKDANDIIPRDYIFYLGENAGPSKGSISGFADFFRYVLLLKKGGFWVDTDVVCLKHFDFNEPYIFAEGYNEICNCVLKAKPEFLKFVIEECEKKDFNSLRHTEIGPELIGNAVKKFNLEKYVKEKKTFNQLHWKMFKKIIEPGYSIDDAYGFHMWNEMWRRTNTDKFATYPKSLYEKLKKEFL